MALYDPYAAYRDPHLTPEERRVLDAAGQRHSGPLSPETAAHIAIAMARAEQQFQGFPPMPEDSGIALRFPGVDPVGRYSVIDMKLARRQGLAEAALQVRPASTKQFVQALRQTAAERPELRQINNAMRTAARRHRTLTRAGKLCLDGEGRTALRRQARSLEAGEAVVDYDLFLQGLEYVSGSKQGPLPGDVEAFYAGCLAVPIPQAVLDQSSVLVPPETLTVTFPDFQHRLLQVQFSDPENWGKPLDAPDLTRPDLDALLLPYAAAAADRTLSALFPEEETRPEALIRVDGVSLRERLEAEGLSSPTPRQGRELAAQRVSSALMAGRQVDVRLPGGTEPVPIAGAGFRPEPEQKDLLAAWDRCCAKQGFRREPPAPIKTDKPPQLGGRSK